MENHVSDYELWNDPENPNRTNNWASHFTEESMSYGIVILGLVANSWMIYLLIQCSKLHVVSKVYLLNRALVDLLYLCNLPLTLIKINKMNWIFGKFACQLTHAIESSQPLTPSLFIGIMSVDNFLVQRYPSKAKTWRTPLAAIFLSLVAWLLTALFVAPFVMNAEVDDYVQIECYTTWPFLHLPTLFHYILHEQVIPLVIIVVVTAFLLCTRNIIGSIADYDAEEANRTPEFRETHDEGLPESFIEDISIERSHGLPCPKGGTREDLIYRKLVEMTALVLFLWLPSWLLKIYAFFILHHLTDVPAAEYTIWHYVFLLPRIPPVINPILVIFVSKNIDWTRLIFRSCSFSSRCTQLDNNQNQQERRTRSDSLRPLNDPTILNDVENVRN